jgi:pyrroline-5-carboxylate reductase
MRPDGVGTAEGLDCEPARAGCGYKDIASVDTQALKACVVALKPQILKTEAAKLAGIAKSGALMLSIAAGTSTENLHHAWGAKARIIRAMPNTPGSIGRGISALCAGKHARPADRKFAQALLAALGETLWVDHEDLIDIVTVVSGSGPAYVFLLTGFGRGGRSRGHAARAGRETRARDDRWVRRIAGRRPARTGSIAPRRDEPAWHDGSSTENPDGG